MSIYYIETSNGVIYELDATVEITYKESGKITDNIVETGESVADHYINNPVMINLSGSISDIKSVSSGNSNAKSTEDFIRGLVSIMKNKQSFSFHYGEKIGFFNNCFFENFDVVQNSTRGNVGVVDSFSITASIKQVRLARRAVLVPFRSPLVSDNYQNQVNGSGSSVQPSEEQETLLQTGFRFARGG
jgi:hypothetical protein